MNLLALALLAAPALIQDTLQKPITFEIRASRLSVLVPQLAAKTGLALEISPLVANEVLVVSAKEVPLKTLLDKIATTASAEWRQEGDVLKLHPAAAARNREANEEVARRLAEVKKSIADRVKALQPSKPAQGGDDEMEMGDGPSDKSITLLLRGIDPAPIAQLNGSDRVVYSTAPNAMQRRMGADAGAIIQAMVSEHNATVGNVPQVDPTGELDKMPDFVKKMIARQTRKITDAHKALLIVSKTGIGMFDMTQVELRIYDQLGKVAFSVNSSLGSMFAGFNIPMPGKPAKPAPAKQTPIVYSEDSTTLLEGFQGLITGGGSKLPTPLMEKLSRPDLTDPLSYMATDELLALTKTKGKALVANVPDEMMGSMNMIVPGAKQTVETFEADLKSGSDVLMAETEGWLIIKPSRPTQSRSNRTDRVALTTLIKAAKAKNMPSLDDVAAYALTSPSPMKDGVGMLFAMALVPGMFQQGISGMTNWDALRFYGTLSPTQRQGASLPVNVMTPVQQSLWRKIAFGGSTPIRTGANKGDDPFMMAMAMGIGGGGEDYREEPTELMPNGLPPSAVLQFGRTSQPMASPAPGSVAGGMGLNMGVLGVDEIAMLKMFKEDPNMAAMAGYMPTLDKLRIGERGVITMTLQLPQEAYIAETLYDNKLPENAPVAAYSDLPPAFQKLVAERLEVLKKSPFGSLGLMMGGMGRGPIKP